MIYIFLSFNFKRLGGEMGRMCHDHVSFVIRCFLDPFAFACDGLFTTVRRVEKGTKYDKTIIPLNAENPVVNRFK